MDRAERAGLSRLMLRWPSRRAELLRCAEANQLRDLFSSYELACTAREYWSKLSTDASMEITDDYDKLITDLEEDLSIAIARFDPVISDDS